jgi:hypothetical protein
VLALPKDLVEIARLIAARPWTEDDWADHESDDEFQTESAAGGFDATERAFCFSVYDDAETEWWVQFTLREALAIASGRLTEIEARRPN